MNSARKPPTPEIAPPPLPKGYIAPPLGSVVYVPRIKIPFQKTLPVVDISQGKVKGPLNKLGVPIQFRVMGKTVPAANVYRTRAQAIVRAAELAKEFIADRQKEIDSVQSSLALLGTKGGR